MAENSTDKVTQSSSQQGGGGKSVEPGPHSGAPLGVVVPGGAATAPASAYLFVEDADELAQAWASAGADVRVLEDTEWGQHEGVVIDPDGNIIRFGSPMRGSGGEP
jgi:hypothetical protein